MTTALVRSLEGMGYKGIATCPGTPSASSSTTAPFSAAMGHVPGRRRGQEGEPGPCRGVPGARASERRPESDARRELQRGSSTESASTVAHFVGQGRRADLAKEIRGDRHGSAHRYARRGTLDEAGAAIGGFLTKAGYAVASWIDAIEKALHINLDFSCVVQIENRGPSSLTLKGDPR